MKSGGLPPIIDQRIRSAIELIATVPDYESVAADLEQRRRSGKIRYAPDLDDRGIAGLDGVITLGPEPFAPGATLLGLAETLVHEAYHLKQNPLLKTTSFWTGVFTGTPPMRRYEKPAYLAALRFLNAVARTHPERVEEANREANAVHATYHSAYGEELLL